MALHLTTAILDAGAHQSKPFSESAFLNLEPYPLPNSLPRITTEKGIFKHIMIKKKKNKFIYHAPTPRKQLEIVLKQTSKPRGR